MSAAKKLAAYWDWTTGAAVPDARIVVCAPSVLSDDARARMWAEYAKGTAFVADVGGGLPYALELYPALHVAHQADLARLPDLLAVKAERRALVVSPEEAIDFEALICEEHGEAEIGNGDDGATPFCAECPGGEDATETGSGGYLDDIDVVFIVGLDKPMSPAWVRSIVEQCRKACVPVVFLGWGEWVPWAQISARAESEGVTYSVRHTGHCRAADGSLMVRVGAERAGALLDGALVEDVPAWLDGAT